MVIATERLLLRPLTLSDAQDLLNIINDKTVREMTVGFPPNPTEETAKTIILTRQNWEKNGTGWQLAVEYNGSLAGLVGINAVDRRNHRGAIDYITAPEYRSLGIASEAVSAFIPEAAERYSLHRISASVFADNIPSRRVLEKSGFILEGIFKDEIKKDGIYRDVAHYGLII